MLQAKKLYLDGSTSNYIYGNSDGQVIIEASYAGLAIYLNPTAATGFIQCGGYLRLLVTDTDVSLTPTEGQVWFDDSENKIKFHNGAAVRTVISSDSSGDITTVGHVTIPADKYLYLGGTGNHIQGNSDNQIIIEAAYAGLAIYLDPSDPAGYIQCGGYFKLMGTDTDGTLFAQMWFDQSENKIKYHNGTAVRTIISSDSSGDITTVGHLTIPDDKYLYFGNTTNFIQGNSDNQLILTGSYAGLAIYLNPSNATGYIQCGGFLRLQVTADVGDVEGQIWYDSGSNKIHFWNGTAEQEVTSGGA